MKKFMLIFVNLLTTIRIIGVFMIVPIFFKYGGIYAALVSIACYLTDSIDGFLARKYHVSTFFGSFFDGVADKLFSCSNLIILFSVTKYSLIAIFFELLIVLIQFIKFEKNMQNSLICAKKLPTRWKPKKALTWKWKSELQNKYILDRRIENERLSIAYRCIRSR